MNLLSLWPFQRNATRLTVGWFPGGPPSLGSAKLRSYQVIDGLKRKNVRVRLSDSEAPILVFQKCLEARYADIAEKAKSRGAKIVWDVSDRIDPGNTKYESHLQAARRFAALADRVVVNGVGLRDILREELGFEGAVIEEPVDEKFLERQAVYGPEVSCVWFGYAKNMYMYLHGGFVSPYDEEVLKKAGGENFSVAEASPFPIATIAEGNFMSSSPTMKYKESRIARDLTKFQVGLSPFRLWDRDCLAKSANKLTHYWAVGLPVLVSATPEYKRLLALCPGGRACVTRQDWVEGFEAMRDPESRRAMGMEGKSFVAANLTTDKIADKWLEVLSELG